MPDLALLKCLHNLKLWVTMPAPCASLCPYCSCSLRSLFRPQMACATVNCRVMPGDSADEVRNTIVNVLNDPGIEVTWKDRPKPSAPSPLDPAVMRSIEKVTNEFRPGVPVMPLMATGASDS